MEIIRYNDVFNPSTLNIFTDASVVIRKNNNNYYFISCPGAVAVATDNNGNTAIIDYIDTILYNCTNNEGEIRAIRLGLMLANKYKGIYSQINLFSDSNICVQGLNQWIYNWVNNIKSDGLMYGSSKKPVLNQDVFTRIIDDIVSNGIFINFFHLRGHIDISNQDKLTISFIDFIQTNNLIPDLPININLNSPTWKNSIKHYLSNKHLPLINTISTYNCYVDEATKKTLETTNLMDSHIPIKYTQVPIITKDLVNQYKQYTQRGI